MFEDWVLSRVLVTLSDRSSCRPWHFILCVHQHSPNRLHKKPVSPHSQSPETADNFCLQTWSTVRVVVAVRLSGAGISVLPLPLPLLLPPQPLPPLETTFPGTWHTVKCVSNQQKLPVSRLACLMKLGNCLLYDTSRQPQFAAPASVWKAMWQGGDNSGGYADASTLDSWPGPRWWWW